MTIAVAILAGLLIGLSLGALGAGGSILAVPTLVFALDQTAAQATTGSLVVVSATAVVGAITALRTGNVLVGRGLTFGLVATGGAAAGAKASAHVSDSVLLAAFAALMVLVAVVMLVRQVKMHRQRRQAEGSSEPSLRRATLDDPIVTFRPTFACRCPRALKVLLTATGVGLLTGFLGVGGGFLVVPALALALALPMEFAAGTSLVVIAVTSGAALSVRAGTGTHPDWDLVALLTVAAVAGGYLGARAADRVNPDKLQIAFTVLLLGVAGYTTSQAVPALV